ncbi:hypothetical protein NEOLEDRAFT_1057035 [Neolentinus lepideus HHB14362 ss-1]|uniref:RMT2 domain-containing protein n=1 Tax=Neolentinus lepideus HHB14362 ss-1 TaxID=1314782 RepID=A0A165V003_9AGAM|nr:hypothetical protein NEOLEDRAFT_1057035 [Neolentinus lepideus HHB14362 ss-1]
MDSDAETLSIHSDDAGAVTDSEIDALVLLGATLIQRILDRRAFRDIEALIDSGAPLWYQDDEEGISALHAAAYVQDEHLIQVLIEKGATWNLVDKLGNTAGDIALSFNNAACYELIRNAGIRSELLLAHLSSNSSLATSTLLLKSADASAIGSTSAFLSSPLEFKTDEYDQEICVVTVAKDDGEPEEVGVMMGWERPIMQETVQRLCGDHPKLNSGLRILNVGFGLGIIDTFFQSLPVAPAQHTIIEPHPSVLAHMRGKGWYTKSGVQVLEGTWQDKLEEIISAGEKFDVVYTDTFSEDYAELHKFFKLLPSLLADSHSRFSFFNGLGATNPTIYDTYTHVSSIHLSQVGLSIPEEAWYDVNLYEEARGMDQDKWGKTRKYWSEKVRFYRGCVAKMSEGTS